jgi:hypothetical protein
MDTNDEQYMELVIKCQTKPEPVRTMERENLDARFGRVLRSKKVHESADIISEAWGLGGAL